MGLLDSMKDKLFGSNDATSAAPKLERATDQSKEDLDLVAYVKNKVEEVRGQANRIAHEGIWMTNIAYILGFDSVYYDPATKQFRNTGTGGTSIKRNRIHSNLLLPAVQNRLARMIKNPPKYDVRPNSLEQDDKDAAERGVETIGMVWDKQSVNRKRLDLGMWLQQCGHAYIKASYDETLGEELLDPETNECLGNEGDIRIDVVSPFECFPDPLAKTIEDCSWFAQAKVRKLDYFRSHYPERGDLVKEEGAWLLSAQYEMRINTLNSIGQSSSGTQEQMKNAAIEISYYERKSPKYPKGRHIVTANGVLLKNGELPCGEIPFAKFDDVIVGGKYYSEAITTHARPLQDQYNRILQKAKQWQDRFIAGKYIAAKGHGLIQEALNDQSGEVVEYDPIPGAPEPHAMQIPVLPEYVFSSLDRIKNDIYQLYGLSDVSRGILPSSSIPAKGLEILLEQDETRMGAEVEQHEHSWARVGMLILKLAGENYITDRKLKVRKGSQVAIKAINGQLLKKNYDVTVIRGSTIPNVKAMKRNDLVNSYVQGLLGNPQDPTVRQRVWGEMEFGNINDFWEDYHVDMAQIDKTIKMIENDQVAPVDQLDNHALHVLFKNRYRKSDKFDALTESAKLKLEQDIQAHVKLGAAMMNPSIASPPDNLPPPDVAQQQLQQQMMSEGIDPNELVNQNNLNGAQ